MNLWCRKRTSQCRDEVTLDVDLIRASNVLQTAKKIKTETNKISLSSLYNQFMRPKFEYILLRTSKQKHVAGIEESC